MDALMEKYKALVCEGMDLINERNFEAINRVYAPNYVRHDPDNPRVRSREEYSQYVQGLCVVFPDLEFTVDDVIAEGDKVTYRFHNQGTHLAAWRSLPPTSKHVLITGSAFTRIVDGQIAEEWCNTDIFGLAQQLGLVPNFRG
jgi:steroid delta-isomerase-like uncharacterized protein